MSRKLNLAKDGQPAVVVDLATLTMVCFSQNGRRIMHYHSDGQQIDAENAEVPFEQARLLRRLQFAKSGFVLCQNDENTIIVDPEKIDYLVIEPAKAAGQMILTIGFPGMITPYITQTPAADAEHLVEVMKRFFYPLTQPLEQERTAYFRSTALRSISFKTDGQTAVFDFDTAGKIRLTPAYQRPVAAVRYLSANPDVTDINDACAVLQTRLLNTIDDLHVVQHQHGTMMITAKSVIAVVAKDEEDFNPRLVYLLEGKGDPEIAALSFATVQERDRALAMLLSGIEGIDSLNADNPRHEAAFQAIAQPSNLSPRPATDEIPVSTKLLSVQKPPLLK